MSGKLPFFLTGANAKILLNGKAVAFATDVTYRVTVQHASPRLLGKYEVEEHQPLAYDVSGSMAMIRYARGIDGVLGKNNIANTDTLGNGLGSYGEQGGVLGIKKALGLPNGAGQFDGNADENLNPGRMFQSKSFDIEIRQLLPGNETTVVLLRGCRITEMGFSLNKKGVATQQLSFMAQYADDDTMIAQTSGVGQELS